MYLIEDSANSVEIDLSVFDKGKKKLIEIRDDHWRIFWTEKVGNRSFVKEDFNRYLIKEILLQWIENNV